MSVRNEFNAAIRERILIKDGPYGTMIQSYRLDERDYRGDLPVTRDQKGNNDLLNLTRPDIIREIAEKYIGAGSEILATNTFNANTISQADYACEHLVGDINREGARLLKGVIDATHAFLRFLPDGRLPGSPTCNRLRGRHQSAAQTLRLTLTATSRKQCAPALMHQEGRLLKLLPRVTHYRIDDTGALRLRTAAGEVATARR